MRWPMGWSRGSAQAGLRLHRRPRGEAGFTVLRAADIPSVLLEIGFMSDDGDLENIVDPDWRAAMQAAIVAASSTGPRRTPCARRSCGNRRAGHQGGAGVTRLRASQTEWPCSSASSGRNQTSANPDSDRHAPDTPPGRARRGRPPSRRPPPDLARRGAAGEQQRRPRRGMGGEDREHGALIVGGEVEEWN
jgi:hypothetical protein